MIHHIAEDGIDFSRNMYNSITRDNVVYDEAKAIFVSQSHHNQISNNTISNSGDGFYLNSGSTNNKTYDNTIMNSKSHAIPINNGSSGNTFTSNKIVGTMPQTILLFMAGYLLVYAASNYEKCSVIVSPFPQSPPQVKLIPMEIATDENHTCNDRSPFK